MLEIIKCSIPSAWYMNHIGKRFKLKREDRDFYIVIASDGYSNIVKKSDGVVIGRNEVAR